MAGGIEAPGHLPGGVSAIWVEIVTAYGEDWERIVGPDLEAYCGQVAVMREARKRIESEGEIVADPKGFAVPHPAIAIERVAQDEIRKWGSAFRSIRRPKPKADAGTGWQ